MNEETQALIALLRHVEAHAGYVQIRTAVKTYTLLRHGKFIEQPREPGPRTIHANIDAWLASLNV